MICEVQMNFHVFLVLVYKLHTWKLRIVVTKIEKGIESLPLKEKQKPRKGNGQENG